MKNVAKDFEKHILKEHSNVHTGAKPFKCKQCPAAFARNRRKAMQERGIKRKPKQIKKKN